MTEMRDLTCYLLVRNDLPSLNPGKAMSQIHHAGTQMMSKFADHPMVKRYIEDGIAQGADHFNTTIVLGATLEDMQKLLVDSIWNRDHMVMGKVVDPSYPFFVENHEVASLIAANGKSTIIKTMDDGRVLMTRQETTCMWCLVDRNQPEVADILGHLKLHP